MKAKCARSADVSEFWEIMQSQVMADDNDSDYHYNEECMQENTANEFKGFLNGHFDSP
jgi:hypothetical protein